MTSLFICSGDNGLRQTWVILVKMLDSQVCAGTVQPRCAHCGHLTWACCDVVGPGRPRILKSFWVHGE